jgi:hypothetical protein
LTIPWNNLRGKPVVIDIKDAYVLAVPRNESTVSCVFTIILGNKILNNMH